MEIMDYLILMLSQALGVPVRELSNLSPDELLKLHDEYVRIVKVRNMEEKLGRVGNHPFSVQSRYGVGQWRSRVKMTLDQN